MNNSTDAELRTEGTVLGFIAASTLFAAIAGANLILTWQPLSVLLGVMVLFGVGSMNIYILVPLLVEARRG